MKNKLVVVIMGQNCEKFLPMCLESVKDADAIVYCDGGSTDKTIEMVTTFNYDKEFISAGDNKTHRGISIIENQYKQDDPQMNGKQRNFYLQWIKDILPDYWCLALDADEVVEDLSKIKEFIQNESNAGIWSVKMRHFQNDLGHEDAMTKEHWVPMRLFKISEAGDYPLGEHVILQPKVHAVPEKMEIPATKLGATDCTTIWHLAHIEHCFSIKKRYDKNLKHSNVHNKQFLDQWYMAHLLGRYPRADVDPTDIPNTIWKHFGINKDAFYFANRGIEIKHFVMASQWRNYIKNKYKMEFGYEPSVIDWGCGRAPYGYAFITYGVSSYKGIEYSQYAVDNAFCPIEQGDITFTKVDREYDLVLAIDILEHLDDEQLNKALDNIKDNGNDFIFSIPFIGDPNLMNDKTHKQFRTKEEWKALIAKHGIEVEDAPAEWAFSNQLLIGTKKNE